MTRISGDDLDGLDAHALDVLAQRIGTRRVPLDGDDARGVACERGDVSRLRAGRGAHVQHILSCLRVERAGHQHRGARLRRHGAGDEQLRALDVERRVQHQALGQLRRGLERHIDARQLGLDVWHGRDQCVDA